MTRSFLAFVAYSNIYRSKDYKTSCLYV